MTRYGIGIDTGGTYTDAVLIDLDTREVLRTAKRETTHHDLGRGLHGALSDILKASGADPARVKHIAVSTTLATNAVVEDKGARVGLLVIGFSKQVEAPAVSVRHIRGGHKITGEEEDPLDMEGLVDSIGELRGEVDVYALSSAMSFVNPAHEQVAAKALSMIDPKPVFCSHQVSSRAGVRERAATSALNARLMPVMQDFLTGVRTSLSDLGLPGEVRIIRGDVTPMDLEQAVTSAASTFASGPAATAHFGASFSPVPGALIVDIGGTTTDVTILDGGAPRIGETGSRIGQWQTHVDSVEMFTVGIGGDSLVRRTESGALVVGPRRVLPLAQSPAATPDPAGWIGHGARSGCIIPLGELSADIAADDPILQMVAARGAATFQELDAELNLGSLALNSRLDRLIRRGILQETGFTPTDALHVLGKLNLGNRHTSVRGAQVLAEAMDSSVENFCYRVLEQTEHRIEDAILEHVIRRELGGTWTGFLHERRRSSLLAVDFRLAMPLLGLGGPARFLLPAVARRLQTEVLFPDHHEVGNALGAILLAADTLQGEQP